MKKTIILLAIVLTYLPMTVSCSLKGGEYEDLKVKLQEIEARISQINSDINSLKTIIQALSERNCVESVTPKYDKGEVIGNTIRFRNGNSIFIRNGKNGTDGKDGKDGKDGEDADAPFIGVGQSLENGIWYWTLNGKWIYDDYNNRLMVYGTDAVVPYVKIMDDYWYISYDDQRSWDKLMPVSSNADGLFNGIGDYSDHYLFWLKDGSYISVPKYEDFSIEIDETEYVLKSGASISIPITIKGDNFNNVKIGIICSDGLTASYTSQEFYSQNKRTITLTVSASEQFRSGHITVVFNNSYNTYTKKLSFYAE